MIIRMPRDFVNDLIEVVEDKLYQADLCLIIFKVLIKSIESHRSDPKTYEAALNLHTDKLATRLGAPVVPDPDTLSHLSIEMPQHVRDTIATAENVRRLSIAEQTSALRTRPYAPRPAFGLGENSTALTIDVERAWNPPPERRGDLPVLREMGENVEVVYDAELEMRASLEHMGMGLWEKEQILAQRVALGCTSDQQDDFDENDDTLVEPPERPGKLGSLLDGKERMVEKEATFMGMPLEDSEDEVSDADEVDHGQEADRQDGGSPGPVKTDVAESGRQRDSSSSCLLQRKQTLTLVPRDPGAHCAATSNLSPKN
ncbi:hypothetical protein E8E11_006595 [Didymella keratinophila]|nr:hypothetical protein E8E11_006595 [Didymella keratinophila]